MNGFEGKRAPRRSYAQDVTRAANAKRRQQILTNTLLIALCIVLPPLGIYILWTRGFFDVLPRILATLLAFMVLFAIFWLILPSAKTQTYQPSMSKPVPITETVSEASEE